MSAKNYSEIMQGTNQVVLVDDNESLLVNVSDYLSLYFDKVHTFSAPQKALSHLTAEFPGVVVTDIRMPEMSGMELLKKILDIDEDLPVILMTAHGEISQAVEAMKLGGYDFIEKPFEPERLQESIRRAMEKRALTLSQRALQSQLADVGAIENRLIGVSSAIDRVRRQILSVAKMDVPVMIHGETGSGKEVVANCLHDFSNRKDAKFVAINCAAIPKDLVESELFGHVKGAFSGAQSNRVGKLEYADGGTLFLDEVESIPMHIQVKLLRALSEGKIEALGSNVSREIDIRVVSASKESLKDNENFRQDLYFRLQVAEIQIPPLRSRKEDIALLFEHYAKSFAERYGIDWPGANARLQSQLMGYDWPGNVRELINVATRCVMQSIQDLNDLSALDEGVDFNGDHESLKELVEQYEKNVLINSLRRYKGSIPDVLKELNLERRTFYVKLQKYDIDRSEFVDE